MRLIWSTGGQSWGGLRVAQHFRNAPTSPSSGFRPGGPMVAARHSRSGAGKYSGMVTPVPAEMFNVTAERRWSCVSADACYVFPWISCQRMVRSVQVLRRSARGHLILPRARGYLILPARGYRILLPAPRPTEWVHPRSYRRSSVREPAGPVETRKQIPRLLQRLMQAIS
jgi:hypothetical protein